MGCSGSSVAPAQKSGASTSTSTIEKCSGCVELASVHQWFAKTKGPIPPCLITSHNLLLHWISHFDFKGRKLTTGFNSTFYVTLDASTTEVVHLQRLGNDRVYEVAPYYSEIQRDIVASKLLRDNLSSYQKKVMKEASTLDLTALRRAHEAPLQSIASRVLHLLQRHFKPIQGYSFQLPRRLVLDLCEQARLCLSKESSLLDLSPPVCILGDLHASYKDLQFLARALGFKFAMAVEFTPSCYLFLGDYVDRGPHSVETFCHLLALKLLVPHKVFLLRGNHETAEVNGNNSFGKLSLRAQCHSYYGPVKGEDVWEAFNCCCDVLPLAAVVDGQLFCVHAGIPRTDLAVQKVPLLESIHDVSRPPAISGIVSDLLWADPAGEEEEKNLNEQGFGPNPRGANTVVFGKQALRNFLRQTGCTHVIRAHQMTTSLGISVNRVEALVTVFSNSHYCGGRNKSAALIVHNGTIKVLVLDPLVERSVSPSMEMHYELEETDKQHPANLGASNCSQAATDIASRTRQSMQSQPNK